MFRLYFGKLGEGKTYSMVADCYKGVKQGKEVYCNFAFDVPDKYKHLVHRINIRDFDKQFLALNHAGKKEAIVALDEGWILFDSYLATRMKLQMRVKIVSLRKHNLSLYITAQRVSALHKSARDIVNEFWGLEKWISIGWLHWFWATEYDLDGKGTLNLDKKGNRGKSYFLRPKIAKMYDTVEDIDSMFGVADLSER